eukprot:1485746-Rhodomonas_salina.1
MVKEVPTQAGSAGGVLRCEEHGLEWHMSALPLHEGGLHTVERGAGGGLGATGYGDPSLPNAAAPVPTVSNDVATRAEACCPDPPPAADLVGLGAVRSTPPPPQGGGGRWGDL